MNTIVMNGIDTEVPAGMVAYKYADPTEDARWIDDESEAHEIASTDPSLIVWVNRDDSHHVAIHGGPIIGSAGSKDEAIQVCEDAGYSVVLPEELGQIDWYDAEDGPGVQGYEHDGRGVWIVACA